MKLFAFFRIARVLLLAAAIPLAAPVAGADFSPQLKRQVLAMAAARDARATALVKEYEDVDVIAVMGLPLPLSSAQAAQGRKELQRSREFMEKTTAEIARSEVEGRAFIKSMNLNAASSAEGMAKIGAKMKLALDAHRTTEQSSLAVGNAVEAYIAWGAALKGADFVNGKSGVLAPAAQRQKDALFGNVRKLAEAAHATAQQTEAIADRMIEQEEAAKKALQQSLSR